VAITGETPPEQRHELVRRFQEDPSVTLFIGNIQAAGVGITLTAASHVVMAELDWVPARLTQAEDRCHRVGQTDNVLVQHLVLEGSLDAVMARRLVRKQQMMDRSLNGGSADGGVSEI
jgi:SWI/SNF-related matrix-associated actin-dependent regulator 1 of chromatin subfamily A